MDRSQFIVDSLNWVVDKTGKKELRNQVQEILDRKNQINAIIDEPVGVERADELLEEDKSRYKQEISPKIKHWRFQKENKNLEGRARIAESHAKILKWREELDEEGSGQVLGADEEITDMAGVERAINGINKATKTGNDLVETTILPIEKLTHNRNIASLDKFIESIDDPLEIYERKRLFRFAVPRIGYLIFTLIVFGIGVWSLGEKLGEQFAEIIEPRYLNLALAVVVWTIQEFLFAPWAEKWTLQMKGKNLKELNDNLGEIRAATKISETWLDFSLNEQPQPK